MRPYKPRPLSFALQVITVALAIWQRDQQHNQVDNSEPFYKEYDYIVVGAGSSGCVVARRLSDRHSSVLLLEAGPPQSFVTDLPGMEQTIQFSGEFQWPRYTIEAQRKIGRGRAIPGVFPEPKGMVMGGTSVINRMVYLRPNPRDFEEWVHDYGAEGWSFREALPLFVRSENNTDYKIVSENPGYHGTSGPLQVSSDPNDNLLLRDIRSTFNEYGIPNTDLNGPNQAGTNIIQLNIRDGFRASTSNEFLEPNPNPKNLFISPNSLVTKILFDDGGHGKPVAVGVEFIKNKQLYTVRAKKEVILSAGTYNSAQLLMLSGIGPHDELSRVGIKTLVDLPVGYNLQDHPQTQFFAIINNHTEVEGFPGLSIPLISQVLKDAEGPLATSSAVYTYFSTKSNPYKDWPNAVLTDRIAQFPNNITEIIAPYSAARAHDWAEYFGPYMGLAHVDINVYLRRIFSQGRVRLASKNPMAPPLIDPNFLSVDIEVEDILEATKWQLNMFETSKLANMVTLIQRPIPGCEKEWCGKGRLISECDPYLRCYLREFGDKEHHCTGTCKMGDKNRKDTVVDPKLRVKNVEQLRVCDASIIPRSPNSNTHALAVMIGEKCADLVSGQSGGYGESSGYGDSMSYGGSSVYGGGYGGGYGDSITYGESVYKK